MVAFTPGLIFLGGPALFLYWLGFPLLFIKFGLYLWGQIPPFRGCGFTLPSETRALRLRVENYANQITDLTDNFQESRDQVVRLQGTLVSLEQEVLEVADLKRQVTMLEENLTAAIKSKSRLRNEMMLSSTLRSVQVSRAGSRLSLATICPGPNLAATKDGGQNDQEGNSKPPQG